MEQRLSFITIGAKDIHKLKQFYIEKFGWSPLKDNGGIMGRLQRICSKYGR
jgi:predicted enzyme related to lactoylglutathione lyase